MKRVGLWEAIWGDYRKDPATQCPPSTRANPEEVQVGSTISLFYDGDPPHEVETPLLDSSCGADGERGWWDCTVISLNDAESTAKV